jgi:hypothetical protein
MTLDRQRLEFGRHARAQGFFALLSRPSTKP